MKHIKSYPGLVAAIALACLAGLVQQSAKAQFLCTTNDGAITIIGYTGPGGDVTIPDTINGLPVTSIGQGAFLVNTRLISVTIPNGVTNIGVAAFQYCFNLVSVALPDSLATIEDHAFGNCTNLPSITIPNGVTNIGASAFYECTSLFKVTIGSGATSIGSGAFFDCFNLTNIVIGGEITSIGDSAFALCGPTALYFHGNAPSIGLSVFLGDSQLTIYFLPGTTGWSSTFGGVPAVMWNPMATNFSAAGGQFGFNIAGPTNATVVVEASADLAHSVWAAVSTNTLSAAGASGFSDPQWTNYPSRYYRFRSP